MGISVRNITGTRSANGSYTGDSNPTQTISGLPFKPKYLQIYGTGTSGAVFCFVNGVTSEVYAQEAMMFASIAGGGTYVQFITSNSFTVTNSSMDTSSFNDVGGTYYWMAWS